MTNVVFAGMCATAPRILTYFSALWMTFFDVLLEDRVEVDDAAVGVLVGLEFILLRTFHVFTVDRAVVRLQMFARPILIVRILVHGVDKREGNC